MQIEGVSISLKRIRRRALYAYQGIECILPLRGQLTVERNGCSFFAGNRPRACAEQWGVARLFRRREP